ncbi:MAG: serine/threonine-protein kinase, partial [Bacteroidota bacterium]
MYNLKELETWFIKALDLPEASRITYLKVQLKDQPELLTQVIGLVKHSDESVFTKLKDELSVDDTVIKPEIDKYQLNEELGRGGMAVVYKAQRSDGVFDHEVAIKVLKPGLRDLDFSHKFDKERNILARLKHEHITQIYDGGVTTEGSPYFVMEIVQGKDLCTYANDEKLTLNQRLRLFLKVCSAIQYAHQNLVIHTDIKPSNVLVNERGEVKLTDFGIAQILEQKDATNVRAVFTPGFASPEQINRKALDVRTDVYQMGMLLKELTKGLKLPKDLKLILFYALQEDIENRYPSMSDFRGDIESFLKQRPIQSRSSHPGYVFSKFIGRNKAVVSLAFVAFLTISSLTYFYIDRLQKANEEIRYEERVAQDSFNFLLKIFDQAKSGNSKGDTLTIFDMLEYGNSIIPNSNNYLVKGRFSQLIGTIYAGYNNYQEAVKYYKEGISFLKEDSLGINKGRNMLYATYGALAETYLHLGNSDTAYYYMKLSEKYAKENELKEAYQPTLYSNLAGVEWGKGNMALADTLYQKSMDLCEAKLDSSLDYAVFLCHYGRFLNVWDTPGKKEKIDSLYQKARFLFTDQGYDTLSKNNYARLVNYQGLFHLGLLEFDKAESYFREAYKLNHSLFGDNNLATLDNLNNLAIIMSRQERHKEAQNNFLKCWTIAKEINIATRYAQLYFENYSATFNSLKEYKTAKIKLDSALKVLQSLDIVLPNRINSVKLQLSKAFVGLKQYQKGEQTLREIIKLHQEVNGDRGVHDL